MSMAGTETVTKRMGSRTRISKIIFYVQFQADKPDTETFKTLQTRTKFLV